MQSVLKTIKDLIPSLTPKDEKLANKFLENKQWESLKDLTWSALKRIESALEKGTLLKKYPGITPDNVDEIRELALLCASQYYIVYPDVDDEEFDDGVEEPEDYEY